MDHKLVTYRWIMPILAHAEWVCTCGSVMKETVMGPALYKEFEAHALEKSAQ